MKVVEKSLAEFDPGYGTKVAKTDYFLLNRKNKKLGTWMVVHSKH